MRSAHLDMNIQPTQNRGYVYLSFIFFKYQSLLSTGLLNPLTHMLVYLSFFRAMATQYYPIPLSLSLSLSHLLYTHTHKHILTTTTVHFCPVEWHHWKSWHIKIFFLKRKKKCFKQRKLFFIMVLQTKIYLRTCKGDVA